MIGLAPERIIKAFPLPGFSDWINYQFRVQLSWSCVRYTHRIALQNFIFKMEKASDPTA